MMSHVSHVHTRLSSPMKNEEQSERFQMRVSPSFLRLVDEWRRKQPDLPSRAEGDTEAGRTRRAGARKANAEAIAGCRFKLALLRQT